MGRLKFPLQLLATAQNPEIITSVNRTKKDGTKEVPCPKAVAVYNDIMGGVDRFDQRKKGFQIRSVKWWHRIFYFLSFDQRKKGFQIRSVKWWHRIFYFLIDLAIIVTSRLNVTKPLSFGEVVHLLLIKIKCKIIIVW
ncbi:piggyBac transposable element-derived protein 4 [Trichonephila clavipes]|nr:piggyBac transposable element-derived protein 4 [Trichonephila clavipes]